MDYPTAKAFQQARPRLPGGIVGIVLCESDRHAQVTIDRLVDQGVSIVIAIGATDAIAAEVPTVRIAEKPDTKSARSILNNVFEALTGQWVIWLWNGEFFVFPYGETRTLPDLTAFLGDERRVSFYTYVLDLYDRELPTPAEDPQQAPLYFDRIGYHAFPKDGQQLRLFGGLGWRFEEFLPAALQPIGRTALLKLAPGIELDRELLFGQSVYDSVSCPWHHNPTGAVMSLRRSRRVLAHPQFPKVADKLIWAGSTRFEWNSRQLLTLGMIEPGQWF